MSHFGEEESPAHSRLIGPPSRAGGIGRLGNYELLRHVGTGGMGMVYTAADMTATDRSPLAAIKLLKPSLAYSTRARDYFKKEARHMERLVHPNILPIIEFHEQSKGDYMVMPFIQAGNLHDFMARHPMEERVVPVLRQVAAALEHAHRRGIIHCDVKPSNILIDSMDHAYLMDFGLSRSLLNDPSIDVQRSEIEGTPQYQSPLAAEGEHEDTRGDIYSFGAVLYEILTGQAPYPGLPREKVLEMIRLGPPTPVLQLNPYASKPLVDICERAMERSLSKRYAHMSYVRSDLENVSADFPSLGGDFCSVAA